ncbi:acetyl-CoA carboxylase biotin carboxylase subunit [Tissierella sp. Yu-01]|uniref:acetyl-CoA carboxylase biotin carboxylase subunit n=1 Tax=Tissierella sp. Yu-01 TaxID=3035694 RepID=UPI00240D3E2C|nr:acetyl-CoA carboxylase biotin carboxylase subunit [Tissierella sp. Yu-01]WFA09265.1 acetyl-CoA carboxylase biotin carboxylase subunit [Tissierella sp. Yu-01]
MFKRVLVANRGEIAVRIIRALREMGIESVAVYSNPDQDALHTILADYAFCLDGNRVQETYTNMDKIINIAKISGADAIHPGYGFLSERPNFAKAVEDAGITFIGPNSDIIRLMGDKIEARKVMLSLGVPLVKGSETAISSYEEAALIADKIGYPVLIKAAAGGGGMGMKIASSPNELEQALETVKNTAISLYADESVFLEKYLIKPRHIEVQVMGDKHGNYVHLGERECSIQRRHMKIVEETPCLALSPEIREEMCKTAVSIAKAVGYNSVGTVEFIYEDNEFYFLEMNTRIQVEHTITEAVTSVDLVKEQISIAACNPLSVKQEDIKFNGHAIECRIYAEDPIKSFTPSPGKITDYIAPGGPGIRLDSGVRAGYTVSTYYDSMLSKLIAIGKDRDESIDRMKRGLKEFYIEGIKTNIPMLIAIMKDSDFKESNISTKFLEEHNKIIEECSSERKTIFIAVENSN